MTGIFYEGAQYPPADSIERLAKYKRMKKLFDAKPKDIYARATEILKDRPQSAQLESLYIAVNLADIIATKPADMLIGDMPTIESGFDDASEEQTRLNEYVENNRLQQLIHESAIGAGYRGDAWLKVRYGYREDYSELLALGMDIPEGAKLEPIIEHANANTTFPEMATGDDKNFKAVNLTRIESIPSEEVDEESGEVVIRSRKILHVERHVPGAIEYASYHLHEAGFNADYGELVPLYVIGEQFDYDVESTGLSTIPVYHIPYKSIDRTWEGIGGLEKVERIFYAINDRLTQIDYILWKHSDPNAYGPPIEARDSITTQFGGMYYEIEEGDVKPGYMTWDAQLDAAFKELDMLISLVFMNAETPQWVFGTVLAGDSKGGTGTSHTDGAAIKSRFMPILSKVARIRTRYDVVLREALQTCYQYDYNAKEYLGAVVKPKINWKDGLPKNEKEEAEIMAIRTGSAPTIDQHTAIKRLDEVDDGKATEILRRIGEDDERNNGIDDLDFFNRTELAEEGTDNDE